ncbi:flagellar protein MotY [Marinobacter bohaiensis]|uniref:flagellar protein MotY n=1 Tax=Marinobacter bohaiensis TaxID=2201898 RepID=UPI000DAE51D0|nr:OmpA family protein [Marinobacter bohaiensis]
MRRSLRPLLVVPLLAFPLTGTEAASYGAGIENSQWYLASSVFSCSLTHEVPGYGRAVFQHRAGDELRFYLESDIRLMKVGAGYLNVEAPSWRPGVAPTRLGRVQVTTEQRSVEVDTPRAMAMVHGLLKGMAPTVTSEARYSSEPVRVQLSNINFAGTYQDYQTCVAGLLPVNFDQIKRSRIHFKLDSARLSDADLDRLDLIVQFIHADSSIARIFVDGHTDRSGTRIHNRTLSENRANAVAEYLKANGIAADKIVTRYHGERYPASGNPADNRRTTVRLEREGERRSLQQAEADIDPRSNG